LKKKYSNSDVVGYAQNKEEKKKRNLPSYHEPSSHEKQSEKHVWEFIIAIVIVCIRY
jgi:hypothetical protein